MSGLSFAFIVYCHCSLQVREFIRQSGNLKGTKWRQFHDLRAGGKVYPSLVKALQAGFQPVVDVQ